MTLTASRAPAVDCSIQDLAPRLGVSARTLRFYEERGLIKSTRGRGGARHYDPRTADRVARIVTLRRHGLSLDQIQQVVDAGGQDGLISTLEAIPDDQAARLAELERLIHRLSSQRAD
ncbi:MerR family transcriptional regulator [Caulobacter segnis]|uniref:MerR family transcriptional regulator n=1 Tax=Caulobacter segnis TaxID=88688 RepID=UPI0024104906|nr:MerR family transcriptional regulator [Caulobacter segnis]MDG2522559.1 MerR family transcriptional regulator [Caulobacter segnis]